MVFLILSEVEGRGKPEDEFFSSLLTLGADGFIQQDCGVND